MKVRGYVEQMSSVRLVIDGQKERIRINDPI